MFSQRFLFKSENNLRLLGCVHKYSASTFTQITVCPIERHLKLRWPLK